MKIYAVLLAISLIGAFADDHYHDDHDHDDHHHDHYYPCAPKPFKAQSFSGTEFRAVNTYTDFTRGLTMNEDQATGAWSLTDFNEGTAYRSLAGGCTRTQLTDDMYVSFTEMVAHSKFVYDLHMSDGNILEAYIYTHGQATVNSLVNKDCTPVFISVAFNGTLAMAYYNFDIKFDAAALSPLYARAAEVEQPTHCVEQDLADFLASS